MHFTIFEVTLTCGMTMILVASLLSAVISNKCVSVKSGDGEKIALHRCPLCSSTSASHLEGKGVEWYIGGNPELEVPVCNDTATNSSTLKSWSVLSGATLFGVPTIDYVLHGTLNVVGSDVTIEGGVFDESIHVIGPKATNINVKDISILNDDVAVRVYRGDPTGALLDVSGLSIENAISGDYVAAIAHTTDSDIQIACTGSSSQKIILQPAVPMTKLSSPGCKQPIDLGKILSVYGSTYEVEFYNFEFVDASPILNRIARALLIIDVVLLLIIGTCHGSKAGALRKAKSE